NYSIIDHGVLTAFAERWYSETNTFHLPIGEVGITLDDVQCLLHLPIEGKLLNHKKISRTEGVELVNTFLGVPEYKVWEYFTDTHGSHITYGEMETVYTTNWEAADKALNENRPMHEVTVLRQQCIRAFLLFLVCTTIFSNKSQFYVDVV
ncbi:IMP dehydrogenase/GMP reductase related, partial [Trifolium pratense]